MIIYTALDDLLDTRYPVIKSLTNIDKTKYLGRKNNSFRYIGADTFEAIYLDRDKRILINAYPTRVHELIIEALTYNKIEKGLDGVIEPSKLVINTYPYELTEEESDLYQKVYSKKIKDMADIELICKEPVIELLMLHNIIITFYGIDFVDKASAHMDLVNNPRRDITVVCPAIIDNIGDEDYETVAKEMMKNFDPYINLQLVAINMFSAVD